MQLTMKLNKWLYGAAAALMLGACSDNLSDGPNDPEAGGSNGTNSAVSGYLAVEIKLPEVSGSTRAGEDDGAKNDNFTDGTPNEYAVDNAMIVVFKGADEKNATFVKAQDLKKPFFVNAPSNDNITSSYIAAIQVPGLADNSTDHYWGLVIINRNGTTTDIDTGDDENNNENSESVTLGKTEIKVGDKFEKVLGIITSASFLKTTGSQPNSKVYSNFFMTNAPLANKPGGGSNPLQTPAEGEEAFKVQYLADLGNKTYDTMDEAKANVKNCIYVERAVSKVTCKYTDASFDLQIVDGNGVDISDQYKVSATVKYALTNTNQRSYLVRNIEFAENDHFKWNLLNEGMYRMVGSEPMKALKDPYHGTVKNMFRTYWCLDPNYEEEMSDADKYIVTSADEFADSSKPLYCKENTFSVANQNHGNTTLAVFEVNFTVTNADGSNLPANETNLYTRDGDNSKIYVGKETAAANEISRIVNNVDIQKKMEECVVEGFTGKIENAEQYLSYEFEIDKDNMLMIKSITLKPESGIFDATGVAKFAAWMNENVGTEDSPVTRMADILNDVNNMDDILVFKGGISYYQIPIKHFGDYYTPWTEVVGTTTDKVYNNGEVFTGDDDHARKYLGRYGMVRNNWYELNLSKITGLGSPEIPEIDLDLSDDYKEEKKYIGVEIHILSWAKRTQNIEFK